MAADELIEPGLAMSMYTTSIDKAKTTLLLTKDPYTRVGMRINIAVHEIMQEEAKAYIAAGGKGLEGRIILPLLARVFAFATFNVIEPLCTNKDILPHIIGDYMNEHADTFNEIFASMQPPEGMTKQ